MSAHSSGLYGTLRRLLLFGLIAPMAQVAIDSRATGASAAPRQTSQRQALILGVPFISWEDAARLEYQHKDVLNPSSPASEAMILEYWGESRRRLKKTGWQNDLPDWVYEITIRGTVTELKDQIAQGIPVMVKHALTPYGHPLALTYEFTVTLGLIKGITLSDEGRPRSNLLGRMVSLELLADPAWGDMRPIREAVFSANRVVVGFDDQRQFFVVMDPTFGPGFEIGYDDFGRMWNAAENVSTVLHPRNRLAAPRTSQEAGAYRPRTPREQAARHYVYGYALNSTGRLEQGEEEFKAGLAITPLPKGYRCLLHFELALNYCERRMWDAAIDAAEAAKAAVPEYPGPWKLLADLYAVHPTKADRAKSRTHLARAEKLVKDKKAQQAVAKTFPNDFWIASLSGVRKSWVGPAGRE